MGPARHWTRDFSLPSPALVTQPTHVKNLFYRLTRKNLIKLLETTIFCRALLRPLEDIDSDSIKKLKANRNRPHLRDKSTHRKIPRTDNDSSLLFVALGKAEPLVPTAARQKFGIESADKHTDGRTDRRTLPSALSLRFTVNKKKRRNHSRINSNSGSGIVHHCIL